MTTRRGFLQGILAAGFAPAFVGSGILMPVRAIAVPHWADNFVITDGGNECWNGGFEYMLGDTVTARFERGQLGFYDQHGHEVSAQLSALPRVHTRDFFDNVILH